MTKSKNIKSLRSKTYKKRPKKQKGGVKYSAGGTQEQNQFLDFLFPNEEEKQKSTDIKFPYNASFNNSSLLGVDFRFYLPKSAKTESKYKYSIDDYMNIIRIAKDIPRSDPRYNQLRDYVKRIIDKDPKTHKISYYNAIYLIMNGDTELGEIKCESKKRDDKDYGEIKEGKELFTALNIDFFDFEREANVRYLNYVFSNPDSKESPIKYFIISSNTSDFFKAVYYTTSLLPELSQEQRPEQNLGINLTGDFESCQYVKSCFTILLFCLLVDNLLTTWSATGTTRETNTTPIESEKNRILNGITKERYEFVEKIKQILIKSEDIEAKKNEHRECFHEYIENVEKLIKSFSLFDESINNAQIKFPEIGEKELYYLLVTNDSYSNLNSIIAKYTTPNFLDMIEKYDLPFELVLTQELMGKENLKSEKIEGEYEKQINELFNMKKESITDYIKNGVTTVISMNEKKEILLVQKIIFGIYLRIPVNPNTNTNTNTNTKNKVLIAIFIDEKTINITKNYVLDFVKLRWVLKKNDKEVIIDAFGGIENVIKVMPFFNQIKSIDEETRESRTSTSYNNAVIMYPGLYKRMVFGLAAPLSYTLKNMTKKKRNPFSNKNPTPEPEPSLSEEPLVDRESTMSVDSKASTVVM